MSTKYKAIMPYSGYFITITAIGWIDIFTRLRQKYVILNALKYCQKHKVLEIYAYCIMHSHIHLLFSTKESLILSDSIRDFKKFTSKEIINTIINYPDNRRDWMLDYFKSACSHLKRKQHYKVWQDGYHAEVCHSNTFIKQKLNDIHHNPVSEKIVALPEDYYFSSARNYAELDNEMDIDVVYIFD